MGSERHIMTARSKRYLLIGFVILAFAGLTVATYHFVSGYPSDSHVTNATAI